MKSKQLVAGQKFAKLTVVKLDRIEQKVYSSKREKSGKVKFNKEYYLCKCDCGKYTIVEKAHLKCGKTKTCGCSNGTHHKTHTRLYSIWACVKKRCYNKKSDAYKNYGGRNIRMCEEWKNDFMSFYNWAIANGYQDTLTIERININGNYEPSNCKWATKREQARNRRTGILVSYKGEIKPLIEWSEILKINRGTLYGGLIKQYSKYNQDFKIVGRIGQ